MDREAHIDGLGTFLVLATIGAYLPQHHRLRYAWHSWGISLWYLLFNAVAAAEQFAVLLHIYVTAQQGDDHVPDTIMHSPPAFRDWLNLIQLGVMWAAWLRLLLQGVRHNPHSPLTKTLVLVIYTAWFAVSIGVVGLQAYKHASDADSSRHLARLFNRWHTNVLNPAATVLMVLSIFPQASAMLWHRSRGSLSMWSLGCQAAVFAALAASWPERLRVPEADLPSDPHQRIGAWFDGGGWAAVDAGVIALVQALLWLLSAVTLCMIPRHWRTQHRPSPSRSSKAKAKQKQNQKAKLLKTRPKLAIKWKRSSDPNKKTKPKSKSKPKPKPKAKRKVDKGQKGWFHNFHIHRPWTSTTSKKEQDQERSPLLPFHSPKL